MAAFGQGLQHIGVGEGGLGAVVGGVDPEPAVAVGNGGEGVPRRARAVVDADDAFPRVRGGGDFGGQGVAATHIGVRHLDLGAHLVEDLQHRTGQHGHLAGSAADAAVGHLELARCPFDTQEFPDPARRGRGAAGVAVEQQEDPGVVAAGRAAFEMEADRARGLHLPQGAQERFEAAGRFLHVAGAGGAVGQAVHRLHADAEQQVDRRAALGQGKQLRRRERPQVGLREAVAGDRA